MPCPSRSPLSPLEGTYLESNPGECFGSGAHVWCTVQGEYMTALIAPKPADNSDYLNVPWKEQFRCY